MKRVIISSSGIDRAHQMYQNRQDTLQKIDNDDYRYLKSRMDQELEEHKASGEHWSTFKPSNALRKEALERSFVIRRNRASGAFPYYIDTI